MPSISLRSTARAAAVVVTGAAVLAGCASPDPSPPKSVGADTGAQIEHITVALPGSLSNLYVAKSRES